MPERAAVVLKAVTKHLLAGGVQGRVIDLVSPGLQVNGPSPCAGLAECRGGGQQLLLVCGVGAGFAPCSREVTTSRPAPFVVFPEFQRGSARSAVHCGVSRHFSVP